MRRSTAFLTAAALAVGGLSLQSQVFSQQQNQGDSSAASNRARATESSNSGRDQDSAQSGRHMDQVKGVQELFARAADAAVSENGVSQLNSLFATREGMESHEGRAGSRTGLSGDNSAQSGTARTSDAAGSDNNSRTGAAETAGSPRTNGTGAAGADSQQLNQIVQQIRQEWKQKYNQDFKITNETVVFADITAADIGARQPRQAGSELRGNRGETSGDSRDLGGDRRGTGASNDSSDRNPSGTSSGAPGGTAKDSGASATSGSERGGAYSRNDHTSSSASGSASSELNADAQRAGERQMGRPITVNVPAVRGTEPVQVRVIHEEGQFKFASHGPVDQQKLQQALETQLREVQSSKSDWPADVNQGYRLVTQHVLMAINDASGHRGESGEHAQPAGSRIRGADSDTGGTSGTSGSSSDSNRSTGSNSNTTGTGSNQNR